MDHQIGLYIVGVLAILGGIELIRFSWEDAGEECDHHYGSAYDSGVMDLHPGRLGVTCGAAMVVFGFVAFYGAYNGWTIMKILSTVMDIAQQYLV